MLEATRSVLGIVPVARPLDVRVLWFEAVTSKARINDWLKLSSAVSEQALKLLFGESEKKPGGSRACSRTMIMKSLKSLIYQLLML